MLIYILKKGTSIAMLVYQRKKTSDVGITQNLGDWGLALLSQGVGDPMGSWVLGISRTDVSES